LPHGVIPAAHALSPDAPEGAPDGGARPHRFLAAGGPRGEDAARARAELRYAKTHRSTRENLAELIMRPHAALPPSRRANEARSRARARARPFPPSPTPPRSVFRRNWRTLRPRPRPRLLSRTALRIVARGNVPGGNWPFEENAKHASRANFVRRNRRSCPIPVRSCGRTFIGIEARRGDVFRRRFPPRQGDRFSNDGATMLP